jgi:hypothetical protein
MIFFKFAGAKRKTLPTMTRLGPRALRSYLALEDCVEHQEPDARPRVSAFGVCVCARAEKNNKGSNTTKYSARRVMVTS